MFIEYKPDSRGSYIEAVCHVTTNHNKIKKCVHFFCDYHLTYTCMERGF